MDGKEANTTKTTHVRTATHRYEVDMTTGPLLRKVVVFALPLALSSVLQLLFNAADVVVVGRFAGKEALAAVGSTGSLINLLVSLFMGLSVGASVDVAQRYGARDTAGVSDTVHTSVSTALLSGVMLAVAGALLSKVLLGWMGTPGDVIDGATVYVRIYFAGMPLNLLYNFGAAVMRGVGDTTRPLIFLAIAGVVNVLLNLLFVIVFRMGVAGVALATIISQGVSAVLVLRCLMHTDNCIRLMPKRLRIHKAPLWRIVKVGLPAGVQSSLFSVSNVLIQSSINAFGSVAMAGNAAASNIEGFLSVIANSVTQGALTFSGQNLGAKRYQRVWRTLGVCAALTSAMTLLLSGLCQLFGEGLLSIYSTDSSVIAYGMIRLRISAALFVTCALMDLFTGVLRGIGYSLLPMSVTIFGVCGLRILWIFTVFAGDPTLRTLYLSYPVSWTATTLCLIVCYLYARRQILRRAAAQDG